MTPSKEIQRADPLARRQAVVMVVWGMVIGGILIALARTYRPALEEWVTRDPGSRLKLILAALEVAVAALTLGLAVYLWRVGDGVVRAERVPAAGTSVLRDTVVLRGVSARRRGRSMQILAVILVLAAAGFSMFLWRLMLLMGPHSTWLNEASSVCT